MTHTALGQYPTPHQVKSLDQVIFPFISYFSHDETVFHFIIHFLSDLSSDLSCCCMMELSGRFLMSNCLQVSEMLLSRSGFPHVYKEAVLPQRKDNQIQDSFSAQLFSTDHKLDSLDYNIRICHQF